VESTEALLAAFDEQARTESPSRPARRAQLAAARAFRYLQVDASSDSAPILRRLGFQPIATTTPYI